MSEKLLPYGDARGGTLATWQQLYDEKCRRVDQLRLAAAILRDEVRSQRKGIARLKRRIKKLESKP